VKIRNHTAALTAVAALVASACGGAALNVAADPDGAVVQAFESMSEWDGASLRLHVDSDVASLIAMAEGDPVMTADLANAILESFVEIKGTSGEDLADTSDDEFSVLVRVGGIDGLQVRSVDGALYLRAAVRELIEEYDTTGTALSELDEMVGQARQFGLDFADAALAGEWLQIEGLDQIASMVEGMTGTPGQPDPSDVEAMAAELGVIFETFVEEDVEVAYIGSEDAGEHVRLTASGDALFDLLEQILRVAGSAAPGMGSMDPAQAIEEFRREAGADAAAFTMPLDAWIQGETVSRIGLDLVALVQANPQLTGDDEIPAGVERFAILVDLEEFGGGVQAPSDAVAVDLFEIFGRMMNSFGGAMGEGFGPTGPA